MKDLKLIMESWSGWRKTVNEGPLSPMSDEEKEKAQAYQAKMDKKFGIKDPEAPRDAAPLETSSVHQAFMDVEDAGAPAYIQLLKKVASHPDFKAIASAGRTDAAGPGDEVFNVKPGTRKAKELYATQAEIGMGQSLNDQLSNPEWAAEKGANPAANALGLKGEPIEMLCQDPRCAIFTFGPDEQGKYRIIDGHHRWSQVMMMNPEGVVAVDNLEPNQPMLSSAKDMLKLVQLAVAINVGNVVTKRFKGENLMQVSRGAVEQAVLNGISDVTLDMMVDAGKIAEPSKELAAKYIGDNLEAIQERAGFDEFTRAGVMPQPADSGTSQDAVAKTLASGDVNFDDPEPSDVKVKVSEARVHKAVRNMLLGKKRRVRQAVRDMLKP